MLTILTGTNNYALRAELKRLIDEFITENGDMALERLDAEDAGYERIQEALQSLPFLSAKKMVVLMAPGGNKLFAERIENLLQELPDTTDLVIVEPKLDRRLSYYKFLKKQNGFREYHELDESGLSKWLIGLAAEQGAVLKPAAARYLVARTGANQQALAHEIEKLSLYTSDITQEVIDDITAANPQSKIFDLLDAAFAGNTRRATELYIEQRLLKVEPPKIIAMIAWQLHVLSLVKTAGSKPPDTVAKDAGISPYVAHKSAAAARRLSLMRIRELVAGLLAIDERLKRESLDADDMLQEYLISLAAAARG